MSQTQDSDDDCLFGAIEVVLLGHAARASWDASLKGRARRARWRASPKGRESNRTAQARYRARQRFGPAAGQGGLW
jgi:hypothetical protein